MEKSHYKIYFDGSCSNGGNQIMGIGLVVFKDDEIIHELAHQAGKGTSNIAEWMGCVLAMKAALLLSREDENCRITVYSDSQLIVNQFIGQYAIKKPEFKPYYNKATEYKSNMPKGCFNGILWVRREFH